jgi:type IV pilus assembly protein PilV
VSRAQAGFGLIELLIASLLFTVGVSALLAGQTVAWRNSLESAQVARATALARDLLARMESNPGALALYALEGAQPADRRLWASRAAAICPGSPEEEPCPAEALAAYDLADWLTLLRDGGEHSAAGEPVAGLPEPEVCIAVQGSRLTVAIAWRGAGAGVAQAASTCGAGGGRFGADDRQRRVVALQTWVAGGQ